jgi:hypothetical protein
VQCRTYAYKYYKLREFYLHVTLVVVGQGIKQLVFATRATTTTLVLTLLLFRGPSTPVLLFVAVLVLTRPVYVVVLKPKTLRTHVYTIHAFYVYPIYIYILQVFIIKTDTISCSASVDLFKAGLKTQFAW